jgi:hypothetical protein
MYLGLILGRDKFDAVIGKQKITKMLPKKSELVEYKTLI